MQQLIVPAALIVAGAALIIKSFSKEGGTNDQKGGNSDRGSTGSQLPSSDRKRDRSGGVNIFIDGKETVRHVQQDNIIPTGDSTGDDLSSKPDPASGDNPEQTVTEE